MPMRLVERDRWLALGLLLLVLALAYAVLLHPWWTVPMLEVNQRIDTLQQRELRLRLQLQQAPQVQQRLDQLTEQQARSPGFLSEASAELATASLIQRLETVVAEASPGNRSCAITNRSPLEPNTRESYTRVTVQARLRCGNPELAAVLYSLENGSPRLFIGNLNVLAQRMYFAPGSGANTGEGGLDVSFDLYGYLPPRGLPQDGLPQSASGVARAPR
jgi:general secretion pathway protein M